jgi:hypothetical protein
MHISSAAQGIGVSGVELGRYVLDERAPVKQEVKAEVVEPSPKLCRVSQKEAVRD